MKKSSKIIIGLVVVAAVLGISYRLVNKAPSNSLSAEAKITAILTDGGCMSCHSANPKLPFYASWPIAKSLIYQDVEAGYRAFDIDPMVKAIQEGKAIDEVSLAKVEKTIADGTMPIMKYSLAHWGSSITSTKRDMLLAAFKDLRAKYYPNKLASAEFANETVRPIPDSIVYDKRKAALGKKLYFDTRLSGDGTVSCASCHELLTGGVDNQSHSKGIKGQLGGVNAPTVYNAAFNFVQFWDGRAKTLADQAGGPPLNPVEMGSKDFREIIGRLKADATFSRAFAAVYPEGMTQATLTNAIEEFEKTLITPNSDFDRYLKGNKNAMTAEQIEGYALFKKHGCATCHVGENMGGRHYDLMGIRDHYFASRNFGLTDGDKGRFAQSKKERDVFRFKTPGLRNVALTAPYFHDGSVPTLVEAVEKMAKFQRGEKLSKEQELKIVAFLKALTGEYQGKKLTNPNMKN